VSFVQRFGSALNAEDVAVTNDRVRPVAVHRFCAKRPFADAEAAVQYRSYWRVIYRARRTPA
jgi:hypothetical protein